MGDAAAVYALKTVNELRGKGIYAECDICSRSLKAQMKYADKLGARYTIVVGDNELETGKAQLKDMQSGEQTEIDLDESLYTVLYNKSLDRQFADVTNLINEQMLGGNA